MLKRLKLVLYLSIAALIAGGMLFVKNNRYEQAVKIMEDLKDKTMVFYSSNFERAYIGSGESQSNDMEKLCMEGTRIVQNSGLNSEYVKLYPGNYDPYTLSSLELQKTLKKEVKYILVDISRGQSRHGEKFKTGEKYSCPITIIISKKSSSHDQSILFAGRVKALIDKKYGNLPVQIEASDTAEYNQGKGYIGMLVELGDAVNTYDEAEEALKILCEAFREVIFAGTQ